MKAGFAALAVLLTLSSVVPAQPARANDPKLDAHLEAWEKKMAGVVNLRSDVTLTRTDSVLKRATTFKGSALCMKPTFARVRLENAADQTKRDYEAWICNGKAVYVYNGLAKTVSEFELPKLGRGADNLLLDFLAGMKAKDVKERFKVALSATDEYYVYLAIEPVLGNDQREFKHILLALYNAGPKTAAVSYLPAEIRILKPNDDLESWKFSGLKVDVPNVDAKLFQYEEIKGWELRKPPPQPIAGGPTPGTPVRPNKP
ncbi:TIGR03009 domain-containing protein [Gemmata sp. JC717]|uniref:TIGR03009 domain-containing protein n=1 Tax=Gemmata algarum TaxID=2975278 RepID=UPI0021BAE73B|nr:TIGR03009 domain-containing protein [Gemmata algarum]MDY3552083.1 TIGR03009 domain-containing protein [Gemmata algarum]